MSNDQIITFGKLVNKINMNSKVNFIASFFSYIIIYNIYLIIKQRPKKINKCVVLGESTYLWVDGK